MREEFGAQATFCDCKVCVRNCEIMPGYLIPADLGRIIPKGVDPFKWAEQNLLASPGALVAKDGEMFRIPTLVSAVQPNGFCIHLTEDKKCAIHEIAPFGCRFFDCGSGSLVQVEESIALNHQGLVSVYEAGQDILTLYTQLHIHLEYKGLVQRAPEELRAEMGEL